MGPFLCYNIFGYNANLNVILSIDVYILFLYYPSSLNSVKVRFSNIQGFCSNFFTCEPFLEPSCPDNLALCETYLGDPIGSSIFSVRGYLHLIQKDSFIHMHGFTVYVKGRIAFACQLSRNLRILIYLSDRLSFF